MRNFFAVFLFAFFLTFSSHGQKTAGTSTTTINNTIAASLAQTNFVFVMKSGSDATGTRGRLDKPFLTLTAAKAAASAGDTIIVYPGTYTNQNNLAKQGVNYDGAVGANLLYVQTTANDPGWGFWDDRTSGAYTNTIVWRGDLQFIGATNASFGDEINQTYDVNTNTRGAFVFTNATSAAKVKFATLKMTALSPQGGVAGIYSYNGTNSFEFDEIIDPLADFFILEDLQEFHPCQSAVFWGIGDLYLRYKHIGRMGQYGLWGGELAGTHTNRMEFYGGLTESKIYVDCHSEEYTTWGYVTEVRGQGASALANAASYYGGGKHYLFFEKLLGSVYGLETDNAGAIPPQVWAVGNKITAGQTWIYSGAGTIRSTVQHYQDTAGTVAGGFIIKTNTTLRVTGGDAAAAGKVVDFRAGKAVFNGLEFRSTNNVAVFATNNGCILQNCLLISKTTSNSIESGVFSANVGFIGGLANRAKSANVTIQPGTLPAADSNLQ